MNIPYYIESYLGIHEWLARLLVTEFDDDDMREHAGYALEEVLLWRDTARHKVAPAELELMRQVDQFMLSKADAIYERIGVNVRTFLTCPL